MANILLLLDLANLWDSCRSMYGKRARVNFKGLVEKAKKKKNDRVFPVAFIANKPEKNQDNLVKKLTEFGFETVTKEVAEGEEADFSQEMIDWVDANLEQIESVVVGGGSTNVIPVLERANSANKSTLVIGFSAGVSKDAANASDDVRLLLKHDTITQ